MDSTSLNCRRSFLRLCGGGMLIGTMVFSNTGKAFAIHNQVLDQNLSDPPLSKTGEDLRYHWLSLAALAPSAHNMQPWMVDLKKNENKIIVYVDVNRFLPEIDPNQEQTMISIGAFLELLSMSASADGYLMKINLFPEGYDFSQPIAVLEFEKNKEVKVDPLMTYVQKRQTNRLPYLENKFISQEILEDIVSSTDKSILSGVINENSEVLTLNDLATEAWGLSLNNQKAMLEELSVTRIGRKEIEYYRDGIAIYGFLPELIDFLGMYPRDRLPSSAIVKSMRKRGEEQAKTAAAWLWLASTGNNREQQILAGRSFIRVHLAVTSHNISLQPMTQLLGQAPALSSLKQSLFDLIKLDTAQHTVHMLCRIGYANSYDNKSRVLGS